MMKRKAEALPVRVIGDKVLRQKAEPVTENTDELQNFIKDLIFTMYKDDGVGLAAPQVGRSQRIFVVDPFWFQEGAEKKPIVLINPQFKEFSGEETAEEGCLSLPGLYGKVNRAASVVIEAMNENFQKVRYEADGLFARSLQHENDHLDGILFIDKLSLMQKMKLAKNIKELKAGTDENGVNIKKEENED